MSHEPDTDEDPGEVVHGLPVPAAPPAQALEPLFGAPVPAVQAAALAATGFVAGAATAFVVARRGRRRMTLAAGGRQRRRLGRRRRKKGLVGEIVSSNSFLVDVHLIRRD
jgi:hypothetical protein